MAELVIDKTKNREVLLKELSDFYYFAIIELTNDVYTDSVLNIDKRKLYYKSYLLFKNFINDITSLENQLFSDTPARILFIGQKYELDKRTIKSLMAIRGYYYAVIKDKSIYIQIKEIIKVLYFFSVILQKICNQEIPLTLKQFFNKRFEIKSITDAPAKYDEREYLTVYIKEFVKEYKNKQGEIQHHIYEGILEDGTAVNLFFSVPHLYLKSILIENSKLNLINSKMDESKSPMQLYIDFASLVIFEPDFMVDVTEAAECLDNSGASAGIHFLRAISQTTASASLLKGSYINHLFDELINDINADFNTSYLNAIKSKPLQYIAMLKTHPGDMQNIRQFLADSFDNLKIIIKELNQGIYSVEPTFISPIYGLQGRLDLLVEYENQANRKDVYELKSGKPPAVDIRYVDNKNTFRQTGLWHSHNAQTIAYNLLLESAYENRTGDSTVIYSQDTVNYFRYSPATVGIKQQLLAVRNQIVNYYFALSKGDILISDILSQSTFPKFMMQEFYEFENFYKSAVDISRSYFNGAVRQIAGEIISSKLGNGNSDSGSSGMWKLSLTEKMEQYIALNNLNLNLRKSNLEIMYLVFEISEVKDISVFRKGDMVILYPQNLGETSSPVNSQIYKAVIKEISDKTIKLSLRNKLVNKKVFYEESQWIIEQDSSDHIIKKHFTSVYDFLKANKYQQNLLLGLSPPKFEKTSYIADNNNLNKSQLKAFYQAISAQNYMLIQGPPGTGKTSYFLKELVRYYLEQTDARVLVCCYTNRAVDEVCSSIKSIGNNVSLLRLGSKESSEHSDILISEIAAQSDIDTTNKLINQTRIFASTVYSLLTNPQIFEIHNFDIAIVDEASQIPETVLIGLLAKVKKFYLIGDEKQLPAIAKNTTNSNGVPEELIASTSLLSYSYSVFERLLRQTHKMAVANSSAIISQQARMHCDIQEFPNNRFYTGQLEILDKNIQTGKCPLFAKNKSAGKTQLGKILAESRITFFDIPISTSFKYNNEHTRLIREILDTIKLAYKDNINENTIGIISAFRAQCSEIVKTLDAEEKQLITVDTVERFQGSERDIIIISQPVNSSFWLSNISSKTEFDGTTICRKLNVSLTRARNRIIYISNANILSEDEVYADFVEFTKQKGKFISYQ